jgi:hypothetical protein
MRNEMVTSVQKIKREAKAKGFHLPGWVGFVAKHPVGILVFRAWMPGKPVFKPVPRMLHAYQSSEEVSTLFVSDQMGMPVEGFPNFARQITRRIRLL